MNVRSCKKKDHVTKKEKQESKDNGGNLTPELSKRERGAVQGTGREISLRAGAGAPLQAGAALGYGSLPEMRW